MISHKALISALVGVSLVASSIHGSSDAPASRSPNKVSYRGLFSKNATRQQEILQKAGFPTETALTEYLLTLKTDKIDELSAQLQAKFPELGAGVIDELIVIRLNQLRKQSPAPRTPSPDLSPDSGTPHVDKIGDATGLKTDTDKLPKPRDSKKTGTNKPLFEPEETPLKKPKKSGNSFRKVALVSAIAITGYLSYRYIQERRAEAGKIS